MPMFDTYVMVDWSASKSPAPRPKPDAIWWAVQAAGSSWGRRLTACDDVSDRLEHGIFFERTRHAAMSHIYAFLRREVNAGRRVLLGFDFAFGYPAGFAKLITETKRDSARSLWRQLSGDEPARAKIKIEDDEKNENNRFEVAAELNKIVTKATQVEMGPFWGDQRKCPSVPRRDPYGGGNWPEDLCFKQLRETDRHAPGAQSVWKLAYSGCVGSQVLTGLPRLHRLSEEFKEAVVWPFDTGFNVPNSDSSATRVVIVEIYPSLLGDAIEVHQGRNEILDRAQVRLNALAFSLLDDKDQLGQLFLGPGASDTNESVEQSSLLDIKEEEGWIFGVDKELRHRDRLESALTEHFCRRKRP